MKKIMTIMIAMICLNFTTAFSQNTFPSSGNVGIGATTQMFKLSLGGTSNSNKIGMGSATSQIQVLYLPDQVAIPGSIAVGNGLASATGTYNTAVGITSLFSNTTGTLNTAVGYYALGLNTTGSNNVGIGHASLGANVGGSFNTGLGYQSLFKNTSGNYNTGLGFQSLFNNISGANNVAIGTNALLGNTSNNNTGVGNGALSTNTTGTNNTAIGSGANVTLGNLNYATAIGAGASVSQSNSIVLGGSGINVGIGTSAPSSKLEINNVTAGAGLKFTQLTNASAPLPANNTNNKSLSVDGSGNVVLINNYWVPSTANTNNIVNNNSGYVIIGDMSIPIPATPNPYKLLVAGGILTEKVRVAVKTTANWADYVFTKDYNLKPLSEVETFISKNKHLPGVQSANEIVKEGIDVTQMFSKQMEKIEELTLYIIELNKKIAQMEAQVAELKNNKH